MASPSAVRSPLTLPLLLLSSAATAGLAVYQWLELLEVRRGGKVACSLNETVNCATVWNSPMAGRIHDALGMPVAALGLVWALSALGLCVVLAVRARRNENLEPLSGAVKLHALVGALTSVMFASASFNIGAVCLTCLGTYALTFVFVGAALSWLPGPIVPTPFLGAAARSAVAVAPVYLALLYPGMATPHAVKETLTVNAEAPSDLVKYLDTLSGQDAVFASIARKAWLEATPQVITEYPTRARRGTDSAPVKIVEFTDVLCPHCRDLEQVLTELERVLPPGKLSIEARYFPLDKECNSLMTKDWGNGVRCLGAKVQICLEGTETLWKVKHDIFARQNELTKELVYDIATKAGAEPEALKRCVASEETAHKLEDDIRYAMKFNIQGTPLVLVNGRETYGSGPFLLGMALSGGDANAPYFQKLPPPPQMPAEE